MIALEMLQSVVCLFLKFQSKGSADGVAEDEKIAQVNANKIN